MSCLSIYSNPVISMSLIDFWVCFLIRPVASDQRVLYKKSWLEPRIANFSVSTLTWRSWTLKAEAGSLRVETSSMVAYNIIQNKSKQASRKKSKKHGRSKPLHQAAHPHSRILHPRDTRLLATSRISACICSRVTLMRWRWSSVMALYGENLT